MFRVVLPPIIRSAYNCIYCICYLPHRYCYVPLSWKSWNRFECAVDGIRHPQQGEHFTSDDLLECTADILKQNTDESEEYVRPFVND
jgi:hypothetical protein